MLRTRIVWTVLGLAGIIVACTIWLIGACIGEKPITVEAAWEIRSGMTLDQVEAILGPERDEISGRDAVVKIGGQSSFSTDGRERHSRFWIGKSAAIKVEFDVETGRVVAVRREALIMRVPSPWERFVKYVRDQFG